MHLKTRNVNTAFKRLVEIIYHREIPITETDSRVGKVLKIDELVTVTYSHPRERVLFNEARDANPFFHFYESLWMLAGRNDVASLAHYNSKISEIASDDGKTFHGAYGERWRKAGGLLNQLKAIIKHLSKTPNSRRVVLEMWSATRDLVAIEKTKDVPCNTHAYFAIENGRLNMTVCNRSNDLVWGMLGANVVHFSYLQEYLAGALGVRVGLYNQVTNNLHVYTERWKPEEWLESHQLVPTADPCAKPWHIYMVDPVSLPTFDAELLIYLEGYYYKLSHPFFLEVAVPIAKAYEDHKYRHYYTALSHARNIRATDWRKACENWLLTRKKNWEKKHVESRAN